MSLITIENLNFQDAILDPQLIEGAGLPYSAQYKVSYSSDYDSGYNTSKGGVHKVNYKISAGYSAGVAGAIGSAVAVGGITYVYAGTTVDV